MELPVFYIGCLFISMPLIGEIFIPEYFAKHGGLLIFCPDSLREAPLLKSVPRMDKNFVGGVTFDDQLFKLYCPGYIIPYIFHLLNKFILATVFSEGLYF